MIVKEDIVAKYSDNRKHLEFDEVEEVLDITLDYLKKNLRWNLDIYAVKIPYLGFIYRKFKNNKVEPFKMNSDIRDKAFVNACYNMHRNRLLPFSKSIVEYLYNDKDLTKVIKTQNENL